MRVCSDMKLRDAYLNARLGGAIQSKTSQSAADLALISIHHLTVTWRQIRKFIQPHYHRLVAI